MKKKNIWYAGLALMFLLFSFLGCDLNAGLILPQNQDTPTEDPPMTVNPVIKATSPYAGNPIQLVNFGLDTTKKISLTNLQGHSVFLIKVNSSSQAVAYSSTGHGYTAGKSSKARGLAGFPGPSLFQGFTSLNDTPRQDHPGARQFNLNPPPFSPASPQLSRTLQADGIAAPQARGSIGDSKKFWVEDKNGKWIQINGVLRATSAHAQVWIAEDNFDQGSTKDDDNKLTQEQAQVLADTFAQIYGYETSLFGFEYGGGVSSTDPTYGGIDGDPKIQILVYDISFDYADPKTSTVLGYFGAKDLYDQATLDAYKVQTKSNQAELFYIDSFEMDKRPALIYSTLAHEFQHMISFNEKYIKRGRLTELWYNEMLSMIAEDLIDPLIGISKDNPSHPINTMMPLFLENYILTGVTDWSEEYLMPSYANAFGFGAYLARNYGGAELIKEIARNDYVNIPSLSSALSKINPGVIFEQALKGYGEAFIYSGAHKPAGTLSFDETVTKSINNVNYTFYGFDIWNMPTTTSSKGPVVWSLDWMFSMPAHSLIVQSLEEWQHCTGVLDITVQQPASPDIDMYIMIR
jgi:hypothetical protein